MRDYVTAVQAGAVDYPVVDDMPGVWHLGLILLGKSLVTRPGSSYSVNSQ